VSRAEGSQVCQISVDTYNIPKRGKM
jgi:hypothetical protein